MEKINIERIIQLDKEIDSIVFKGNSFYQFKSEQDLNEYDKKIIKNYGKILDLIIETAKEEKTKNIKVVDNMLKTHFNTATQMLESYISVLEFYREFCEDVIEEEINALNKIKSNLILDHEIEINNVIELADCYFQLGDEKKARSIMLKFIKNNPDEDEPYQCMENWYMYHSPDINKLAEVIDLAETNGHILITDFGYL